MHRRTHTTEVGGTRLGGILWQAREREPIMGVWAQSPQQGPGAELPLVRRSGGQSPLKSWKPFSFWASKESSKFVPYLYYFRLGKPREI